MTRKKIIVTGGAGFIGSHTVVELYEAGFEPIIVDNFINSSLDVIKGIENIIKDKITWYQVDCNDWEGFNKVFQKEIKIEGVIHFAAHKAVGESVQEPLKYYKNNVGSLITLFELMETNKVQNLVFSSSCTVYGDTETLPVDEKSPFKPAESPYGNTKQICEEIIRDQVASGKNYKAIALRYFNPIGAHPSSEIGELPIGVPSNLIPFITQTAIGLRKELTIFGNKYNTPDGTCIRDYIHVVDLAKAHVKAIVLLLNEPSASYYNTFNLGTGNGNSVLDVIKTFEKVSKIKLNYKFGERRRGDVEKIYASTTKANKELQWETKLELEQALKDAWNWQLKLNKK